MNKEQLNIIKKRIIYRCSRTGTKETDLIYKHIFLDKLDNFNLLELKNLYYLLNNKSDIEILDLIKKNKKKHFNLKKL